jgi:hypothetical protein
MGVVIGGITGTYMTRYFGLLVVLGAILGLLMGQWSKNRRKNDIIWVDR